MKTLIINAHPNFENKDSFSYKLQNIKKLFQMKNQKY